MAQQIPFNESFTVDGTEEWTLSSMSELCPQHLLRMFANTACRIWIRCMFMNSTHIRLCDVLYENRLDISWEKCNFLTLNWATLILKQEAHGPRFAHLSDIATADMQMLCNIFPILSSQLMKISSFEQFLVLKNKWAWQSMEHDYLNILSITFQQKDQCEIWWKLAKWFLKNHDFIHINSTVAVKYYRWPS